MVSPILKEVVVVTFVVVVVVAVVAVATVVDVTETFSSSPTSWHNQVCRRLERYTTHHSMV